VKNAGTELSDGDGVVTADVNNGSTTTEEASVRRPHDTANRQYRTLPVDPVTESERYDKNPVIAPDSGNSRTADPFAIVHDGDIYCFFEEDVDSQGGALEIWVARSTDGGRSWSKLDQYNPIHSRNAFPYVWRWGDTYYATHHAQGSEIQLHKTSYSDFPGGWNLNVSSFDPDGVFVSDQAIFRHNGKWWLIDGTKIYVQRADDIEKMSFVPVHSMMEHRKTTGSYGSAMVNVLRSSAGFNDGQILFGYQHDVGDGERVGLASITELTERTMEYTDHGIVLEESSEDTWESGGAHHMDMVRNPNDPTEWVIIYDAGASSFQIGVAFKKVV
jgi:hypothetical protein